MNTYPENINKSRSLEAKNKLASLILALSTAIFVNFEYASIAPHGSYNTSVFISEFVFRALIWTFVAFIPLIYVTCLLPKESDTFDKRMIKIMAGSILALALALLVNALFFGFFSRFDAGIFAVPIFSIVYLLFSLLIIFLHRLRGVKSWLGLLASVLILFGTIFHYYNQTINSYEAVRNEEKAIVESFENYIVNLSKKSNLTENEAITFNLYKNCNEYDCAYGAIREIQDRMDEECKFRCENLLNEKGFIDGELVIDEYVDNNSCKHENSFTDVLGENPGTRCNCDCVRGSFFIR